YINRKKIEYKDYLQVKPEKYDFVYIDPPYHPTEDNSFTTYTKLDFTEKDQINLRDYIVDLNKKGVKVMLSNSKTKFILDIYKSSIFKIDIVKAPRFVNCKPEGRDFVEEVLITNY
ncbi:MAG: DNA adenine methylase, partial [Actinobacteria bacterium]|nr:DNA adenine methylase [Actinomycetota bacterium]